MSDLILCFHLCFHFLRQKYRGHSLGEHLLVHTLAWPFEGLAPIITSDGKSRNDPAAPQLRLAANGPDTLEPACLLSLGQRRTTQNFLYQ